MSCQRSSRHDSRDGAERTRARIHIAAAHQSLTNEDGVDSGRCKPFDITHALNAALAHYDRSGWDAGPQLLSDFEGRDKCAQITIVDAYDCRARPQRSLDFALVVNLD